MCGGAYSKVVDQSCCEPSVGITKDTDVFADDAVLMEWLEVLVMALKVCMGR